MPSTPMAYQAQTADPSKPNYAPPSILGYNPMQAYQDYLNAFNATSSTRDNVEPLPFNEWFQDQAQNTGTYGIANLIQIQYAEATGQEMSSAQKQQMYRLINQMPPTVQGQILAAGANDYLSATTGQGGVAKGSAGAQAGAFAGSQVSSLLKNIQPLQSFLYGISGGIAGSTVAGSATDLQAKQKAGVTSQFYNSLGYMPSPDQINAMMGLGADALNQYLGNQTYKLGLTLSAYENSQSQMNKLYMKYFGRNAKDDEIAWGNGKSEDDIMSHIMASKSRVDGLNMGQYTSYKKALDDISTKYFGYAAPDEMVKALHEHVNT